MMDGTQFAALDRIYEAYAHDEHKNWEEEGKPTKHIWWAWQHIGAFIAEEKERREQPGGPE